VNELPCDSIEDECSWLDVLEHNTNKLRIIERRMGGEERIAF